jgi:hypothetical protein
MFLRELKWFFGALILSAMLAVGFVLVLEWIDPNPLKLPRMTLKNYLVALVILLLNFYGGRFISELIRVDFIAKRETYSLMADCCDLYPCRYRYCCRWNSSLPPDQQGYSQCYGCHLGDRSYYDY